MGEWVTLFPSQNGVDRQNDRFLGKTGNLSFAVFSHALNDYIEGFCFFFFNSFWDVLETRKYQSDIYIQFIQPSQPQDPLSTRSVFGFFFLFSLGKFYTFVIISHSFFPLVPHSFVYSHLVSFLVINNPEFN